MMVLEIELQRAESILTRLRTESDSRIHAAIPERTFIGPVLQVHIFQFLGTHGIEIQIPSTAMPNRSSWELICRWKNRYVDESHLRDPGHNPTCSEFLLDRSITKESEPCSTKMKQSSIEETHATQFEIQTNPVYYSKDVLLVDERKWNDILAYKFFNRRLSSSRNLKTGHEIGTSL